MKFQRRAPFLCSIALVLAAPAATQELRWPAIFADHAVLQADEPIVVRGRAAPGAEVLVTLDGETGLATAGTEGRWRVRFPARPASDAPFALEARTSDERLTAEDLVCGEVWLASGQSNMVWPLARCDDLEEAREGARGRSRVRLFHAPPAPTDAPVDDVAGEWIVAAPETVARFSAVAWHFARTLEAELDVPVGVVLVARGGTNVEAWTPPEVLETLPEARGVLDHWTSARGEVERGDAWAARDLDDSSWPSVALPGTFADLGLEAGVAWFRRTVALPEAWAGARVVIDLGRTDDTDSVWVDGAPVGGTSRVDQDSRHAFTAPAGGPVRLAVRVRNHGGKGGFIGASESFAAYREKAPEDRVSLAGPWRAAVGSPVPIPDSRHRPGHHWTGMIEPLTSLPVRGVIWYQGERNARAPAGYAAVFGAMIESWRARFERPALPFLFVQLPNFEPGFDWPRLREAQLAVDWRVPDTGMVVAIDEGDPQDIHPRNKRRVGERLARLALHDVHGRADLVARSPRAADTDFQEERALVIFNTGGAPLATSDGAAPRGFALAGEDRVFHAATASVQGPDLVVVRCDAVARPVALRYAWASDPGDVNLGNEAGLPASPFRTDVWER